ncbi:MAG: hypothetical protein FD144_5257 [Rhodospirillaceae bacterium]|nr:MAG: hypothetical protein FD144_5257 [Rhodospirillaceae bacterium]
MAGLSIGRAIRGSLSGALVVLGVLVTDSAARAQSQEADEQCREAYVGRQQTIEICSALIDSGSVAGKDLAAAYNQRGKAYTSQRQYDRAISDFDEAIRIDPAFIDAYVDRGHAHALGGDIDRGIEDIDRAILLDPDNPDSLMARASWYRSKGEANHYYRILALNDLDRVVELDRPDPAMAFHMRADILQRMGLHTRAIEDYSKVIQADLADHWIMGAWLGRCRSEEALELFREAVASCGQVIQRKGLWLRSTRQRHHPSEAASVRCRDRRSRRSREAIGVSRPGVLCPRRCKTPNRRYCGRRLGCSRGNPHGRECRGENGQARPQAVTP